jgi:hypothetical protein
MTQDEEVRAMEIATQLVLGPLSGVDLIAINAAGHAIVDLWQRSDTVEEIMAVGELLVVLTLQDRKAIKKGGRWGRRSRALSRGEAREVLCGLTIDQVKKFSDRWGYGRDEIISWAMGYGEIPHGLLVALGDVDEMAKITGETR